MTYPGVKFSTICHSVKLFVYVNADYGRDIDKRRLMTAYISYSGGSPVSWKSPENRIVNLR